MIKDLNGLALVFIIIGAILIAIALRIGNYLNHFCDKCYSSLAGCAYEYQKIKRAFRKNVNDYDLYITVQIRATCPNCGNIITIKKDFKINPGENPQYKIDEYCREYFKH